jgi:hypothetical protein
VYRFSITLRLKSSLEVTIVCVMSLNHDAKRFETIEYQWLRQGFNIPIVVHETNSKGVLQKNKKQLIVKNNHWKVIGKSGLWGRKASKTKGFNTFKATQDIIIEPETGLLVMTDGEDPVLVFKPIDVKDDLVEFVLSGYLSIAALLDEYGKKCHIIGTGKERHTFDDDDDDDDEIGDREPSASTQASPQKDHKDPATPPPPVQVNPTKAKIISVDTNKAEVVVDGNGPALSRSIYIPNDDPVEAAKEALEREMAIQEQERIDLERYERLLDEEREQADLLAAYEQYLEDNRRKEAMARSHAEAEKAARLEEQKQAEAASLAVKQEEDERRMKESLKQEEDLRRRREEELKRAYDKQVQETLNPQTVLSSLYEVQKRKELEKRRIEEDRKKAKAVLATPATPFDGHGHEHAAAVPYAASLSTPTVTSAPPTSFFPSPHPTVDDRAEAFRANVRAELEKLKRQQHQHQHQHQSQTPVSSRRGNDGVGVGTPLRLSARPPVVSPRQGTTSVTVGIGAGAGGGTPLNNSSHTHSHSAHHIMTLSQQRLEAPATGSNPLSSHPLTPAAQSLQRTQVALADAAFAKAEAETRRRINERITKTMQNDVHVARRVSQTPKTVQNAGTQALTTLQTHSLAHTRPEQQQTADALDRARKSVQTSEKTWGQAVPATPSMTPDNVLQSSLMAGMVASYDAPFATPQVSTPSLAASQLRPPRSGSSAATNPLKRFYRAYSVVGMDDLTPQRPPAAATTATATATTTNAHGQGQGQGERTTPAPAADGSSRVWLATNRPYVTEQGDKFLGSSLFS